MNMDVKKHHNVIFAFVLGMLLVASFFLMNCCGCDTEEKVTISKIEYGNLQKKVADYDKQIPDLQAKAAKYDAEVQANKTLQDQYDVLAKKIGDSGSQQSQALLTAQDTYRELETKYLALQTEATLAKQKVAQLEQDVLAKQTALDAKEQECENLRQQTAQPSGDTVPKAQYENIQKELNQAKIDLQTAQANLGLAQTNLEATQKDLVNYQKQVEKLRPFYPLANKTSRLGTNTIVQEIIDDKFDKDGNWSSLQTFMRDFQNIYKQIEAADKIYRSNQ